MTIKELILGSEEIVKQLTEAIDRSEMSLKEAEKKILEVVNRIGQLMVNEVVAGVKEPVLENQVEVDGETVVFNRSGVHGRCWQGARPSADPPFSRTAPFG